MLESRGQREREYGEEVVVGFKTRGFQHSEKARQVRWEEDQERWAEEAKHRSPSQQEAGVSSVDCF